MDSSWGGSPGAGKIFIQQSIASPAGSQKNGRAVIVTSPGGADPAMTSSGRARSQTTVEPGALRTDSPKDLWPKNWTSDQIEGAIRQAYRKADTQFGRNSYWNPKTNQWDEIINIQANVDGRAIQIFYNKTTKTIESAWMKGPLSELLDGI